MSIVELAFEQGEGILRLKPAWVPRVFCVPGRRIKLHPDDYYALGGHRGGIDERWLASTTPADNGPDTSPHEGLSFGVFQDGSRIREFLFKDAVDELRDRLIGPRLWREYRAWPMYSKFFDNQGPLPFHIHHRDADAARTGKRGKPEAYYFPPQLNNHGGDFPHTYFGLRPGVRREEVRAALEAFTRGDNHITDLSQAARLVPGDAWDVPPGTLHAPGSLCTYEPQKASDVFAMYQSLTNDQIISEELLWKDSPADRRGDFDCLLDLIDWEVNTDPEFMVHRNMKPRPAGDPADARAAGFEENWICYKSDAFSAKELTVAPGATVTVKDRAAYGMILLQGHGALGVWDIETPALIRFGALTRDEFFVSEAAAAAGVRIVNRSDVEPLVMLKHFGPKNPDLG